MLLQTEIYPEAEQIVITPLQRVKTKNMKRRNFLKISSTAALTPAASLLSSAAVKKNTPLHMTNENTEEGLKRVVGISGLALSIVNGVIGSGIFVLPAIVGIAMGAFGLFSYIVCSIMLASIMLCYAEIGSRVTSSGGSYAYVEAAFGNFFGFIINWLFTFGWGILGSAAVMNILADSLALLFPDFLNPLIRGFFFFILIGFMVLINIRGTKQGIGLVKLITIIKVLPLLGIIIFGFSQVKTGNLHWEHIPSLKTFGDTALILFYAFAGFETSLGVSGEFKNPKRDFSPLVFMGTPWERSIPRLPYTFVDVDYEALFLAILVMYRSERIIWTIYVHNQN